MTTTEQNQNVPKIPERIANIIETVREQLIHNSELENYMANENNQQDVWEAIQTGNFITIPDIQAEEGKFYKGEYKSKNESENQSGIIYVFKKDNESVFALFLNEKKRRN